LKSGSLPFMASIIDSLTDLLGIYESPPWPELIFR
jgi:hypothetical protein